MGLEFKPQAPEPNFYPSHLEKGDLGILNLFTIESRKKIIKDLIEEQFFEILKTWICKCLHIKRKADQNFIVKQVQRISEKRANEFWTRRAPPIQDMVNTPYLIIQIVSSRAALFRW